MECQLESLQNSLQTQKNTSAQLKEKVAEQTETISQLQKTYQTAIHLAREKEDGLNSALEKEKLQRLVVSQQLQDAQAEAAEMYERLKEEETARDCL